MTNIGNRIKRRREELGLTQEDLALKLGYKSKSTINKVELGINDISQAKILSYANVLNTTPAYLMGWDEDVDYAVKLSSGEEFLIECHRSFDDDSRTRLIEYAKRLKELNTFDSQLLNAAHKRTDIDIPEDADTSEDDIMDDPNF